MKQYNIASLFYKGHVFVEIRKGIYCLLQYRILVNKRIMKHLSASGYHKDKHIPGLLTHKCRPINFCLFCRWLWNQILRKKYTNHLMAVLCTQYEIITDWNDINYCGCKMSWDHQNSTVKISLPGYVEREIHKFQPPFSPRKQHAPHAYSITKYGATTHLNVPADTFDPIDATCTTRLQ